MSEDVLAAIPAREGHFLLESGYHSDLWFALDAMFADPAALAPMVTRLCDRLAPHHLDGICGPLVGGAFLAQSIAMHLGLDFYYTEPRPGSGDGKLFTARYDLPPGLRPRARDRRLAVVDDVISAGSSIRATASALAATGATTVVVATPLVLGTLATEYFAAQGVPFEALHRRAFATWKPEQCPRCLAGEALVDPR